MVDNSTGFSAPPGPPDGYEGPNILLLDDHDRELARLFTDRDKVIIRTSRGAESADTVSGTLSLFTELLSLRNTKVHTPERPWATRPIHGVLLLAVANHWPEIECADRERYHLTLAYALPLALDTHWRLWSEKHMEELIDSTQLVAVPATDFVVVQPCQDLARNHRRLLDIHAETTVTEHRNIEAYLGDWCRFSKSRYGYSVPENERSLLNHLLLMSGCCIRDVINGGEIIGRSVVCRHLPSRTMFDLMATWRAGAGRLRPGIFSGVYNVLDALDRRLRYSLCYGQFPYKDEIVGPSSRLTLHELIKS